MQQKKRTRPQNSSIMEFEITPTQFQPQSCQYNKNQLISAGLPSGKPPVQTSARPTLSVFKQLKRKCCLSNEICKRLDFLVFLDKKATSLKPFAYIINYAWDDKGPTHGS